METLSLSLLRRARRNRHLTIERVAELVGKNKATVWRYENGTTPMTVEMLFMLLAVYRISIKDVVVKEGGRSSDKV